MAVPDVFEQATRFRRALLTRDAHALDDIARAYRQVEERATLLLARLTNLIQARRDAGDRVPVSWLVEAGRLQDLSDQVAAEVHRILPTVERVTRDHTAAAGAAAAGEAVDLVRTITGGRLTLRPLRTGLVEQITGQTTGGPLRGLLDRLPGDAGDRVARALTEGVALGRNPNVIAVDAVQALGGNRARAQTIARTEALRAYRETSRAAWQANPQVVAGWQWYSTLDRTTCPSCVAMHGTIHALDEPMGTHPSCRCTMVPVLRPGLGQQPVVPAGPEVFDTWPRERQLATVGPAKLAALQSGRIRLPDLVRTRTSPEWGVTRSEASLTEALANADRRARGDR